MARRKEFTDKLKEKIFLLYKGKCADCGEVNNGAGWYQKYRFVSYFSDLFYPNGKSFTLGGLEIHHIIPVVGNGTNKIENLILLCPSCHKGRHSAVSKNRSKDLE